jgi:hypothetical protein
VIPEIGVEAEIRVSIKVRDDSGRLTLANRRHGFGRLGPQSSLSIQPFEGSRFVRGGRYGISIDFGLEVVEKGNICGATFK